MVTIKITQNNFEKEVMDSKIPVILDFWAPWCGPCKMMGPVFEELSNEYEGKVKFGKVNTEEEQWLASQFGVQGIPTLSIVYEGEEKNRIVGFGPKDFLKKKIDEVLE